MRPGISIGETSSDVIMEQHGIIQLRPLALRRTLMKRQGAVANDPVAYGPRGPFELWVGGTRFRGYRLGY